MEWCKLALPVRLSRCRRAVQRANRVQLWRNTRVKRLSPTQNTTRNRGPLLKNGFLSFPATAGAAGACLLGLCTLYTVLFHLRQWARTVSSDCKRTLRHRVEERARPLIKFFLSIFGRPHLDGRKKTDGPVDHREWRYLDFASRTDRRARATL